MPIAYHGRSSSVVVSGTPVHRPRYTTDTHAFDCQSLVIVALHAGCCCQQSVARQVIRDIFRGQIKPDGASVPECSPCQTLDFELEMVTSQAA